MTHAPHTDTQTHVEVHAHTHTHTHTHTHSVTKMASAHLRERIKIAEGRAQLLPHGLRRPPAWPRRLVSDRRNKP